MNINKVAVIGAGMMGGGIAAHVANAGFPVVLLDIVPEGAENRNEVADSAVERLLKSGAFMHPDYADRITTGNLEDHLELLADVDWIIEAVIERLDIKSDLYARVDKVRKPGSIVSSNTSTIPLSLLTEGQSERFAADFLVTHFFNPPRHMRLLELVQSEHTRADALQAVRQFGDVELGKGIVECKDRPGFIANRIGVYWMQLGLLEAFEADVTVEEADALMSRPVGIPKTGIFGLWDLVGIDLGPHLIKSLVNNLPKADSFHAVAQVPELVKKMIAGGYTGRKGKGGFYRINKESGNKVKEAVDLVTGNYRPVESVELASLSVAGTRLFELVNYDDPGGRYAWQVLSKTLCYAASLVPEICDDIVAVDKAMKLGYAWQFGPFELIDQLGASWFVERLKEEGRPVPELLEKVGSGRFYQLEAGRRQYFIGGDDRHYQDIERPDGVLLLEDLKLRSEPLARNCSASLWDIGDGVACLEFHTKMNALDTDILTMIGRSIEIVRRNYQALVLYNEGKAFSAGANLSSLLHMMTSESWSGIKSFLETGQATFQTLKYAPFPVVGAPTGLALGGGCEVLLHCDAIQAHAETYAGLVETNIGAIPGWGGCKEMLARWTKQKSPLDAALKVFELVSAGKVSASAAEAKAMGILREGDGITMNRDRLLADAKTKALTLAVDYQPPSFETISLAGKSASTRMQEIICNQVAKGKATPHDAVVGAELAKVLCGGESEEPFQCRERELYALESTSFINLLRHPDTRARIEHMLKTGKPLRN